MEHFDDCNAFEYDDVPEPLDQGIESQHLQTFKRFIKTEMPISLEEFLEKSYYQNGFDSSRIEYLNFLETLFPESVVGKNYSLEIEFDNDDRTLISELYAVHNSGIGEKLTITKDGLQISYINYDEDEIEELQHLIKDDEGPISYEQVKSLGGFNLTKSHGMFSETAYESFDILELYRALPRERE